MKDNTERLLDTLLAPPFNIVPAQVLDFTAYLCGIEEGKTTTLHSLTDGEKAHAAERLYNCTHPELLKDEWLISRNSARQAKTAELLNEEGAAWLY